MAIIDFRRVQELCQITMGNNIRRKDEDGDMICMRDPYKKCIPESCFRLRGRLKTTSDPNKIEYDLYNTSITESLYRDMNQLEHVVYDKLRDLLINSKNSKEMNNYIRTIHSAIFDSLTEWDLKECKTQTRD